MSLLRLVARAGQVAGLLCLLPASGAQAQTPVTLSTNFTISPVFADPASPSFSAWNVNALNALKNGLSSVGNPATDPTAYFRVNTLSVADITVTLDFHSWRGRADPAGSFSGEFGNELRAPVIITGNGAQQFELANLFSAATSTDQNGDFADPGSFFSADTYGQRTVGINWGADRKAGTADDIVYNAGQSATLPVDAIIYTGPFNSFVVDSSWPGATDQAKLDDFFTSAAAAEGAPFSITRTYQLYADDTHTTLLAQGSTSVRVNPVPEPSSRASFAGLLLLSGLLLWARRRRAGASSS